MPDSVSRREYEELLQKQEETMAQLARQQEMLLTSSRLISLGELATHIGHEIKNPLAIIQLLTEQLKDMCKEDPVNLPEITATAQEVSLAAERIDKIISGLKLLSRDGGQDPLQSTDIRLMIEASADLCRPKFKKKGICIQIENIPEGLLIECRSTQIIQVLVNLLNNAFDAIELLSSPWVSVAAHTSDEIVEIAVTDSESGLSSEVLRSVFQPFFTTKEVGKGTGIGLSVSKKIVNEHGGILAVDTSCVNTRFVVRLPRLRSQLDEK